MCVLSFSTTSVWNIAYRKKNCACYSPKYTLVFNVKYPFFLFNEIWIFSTDFKKNTLTSNSIKIHPVGAELFHEDGRSDMTKIIVFFWTSASAPKDSTFCPQMALKSLYLSHNKNRLFPHTAVNDFFDNQDRKCLLLGTNWMFKNSLDYS